MQQTPKSYRQVLLEGGSRVESPDAAQIDHHWHLYHNLLIGHLLIGQQIVSYSPSEFSSLCSIDAEGGCRLLQLLPNKENGNQINLVTGGGGGRPWARLRSKSVVCSLLKDCFAHKQGAKKSPHVNFLSERSCLVVLMVIKLTKCISWW